ncbi:MAG: hypothetical protein ORN54_00910 [Cyclobacteriaceae bacterium]|nr:hypothetical protein [Cyclobacteriaceae bacterium]
MAQVSSAIIDTLRATATKIESDTRYQWGHMGLCNCGFLAQEITKLTQTEIHTRAMQRHGDWTEQLNDYCPTSGLPMDQLIDELIAFGFSADDLCHLEKLSDGQILRSLPIQERNLHHNIKRDVVKYLRTWANLVEDQLLSQITLILNEERPELIEVYHS